MRDVSLPATWVVIFFLVTMISALVVGPEAVGSWYGRFAGSAVHSYHEAVNPVPPRVAYGSPTVAAPQVQKVKP